MTDVSEAMFSSVPCALLMRIVSVVSVVPQAASPTESAAVMTRMRSVRVLARIRCARVSALTQTAMLSVMMSSTSGETVAVAEDFPATATKRRRRIDRPRHTYIRFRQNDGRSPGSGTGRRAGDQAFALHALAGQLADAANGF